jgi:tetratricopeptide (TPR) repeat protein
MQIKCTSCGANHAIKESSACSYCGNPVTNGENEISKRIDKLNANGNLFKIAETSFEGENYEEAIVYYNKCLEIDSDFFEAWYKKGISIFKTSTINELYSTQALSCFKQSIQFSPDKNEFKKRLKVDVLSLLINYYSAISIEIFDVFDSTSAGEKFVYRFKRANILLSYMIAEIELESSEIIKFQSIVKDCRMLTLKATLKSGSNSIKKGVSVSQVISQLKLELLTIDKILSKLDSLRNGVNPSSSTNNSKSEFLSKSEQRRNGLILLMGIIGLSFLFYYIFKEIDS